MKKIISILIVAIIFCSCEESSRQKQIHKIAIDEAYEKGLNDGKKIARNAAMQYFAYKSKDTLKVELDILMDIEDSIETELNKEKE